jgi:methionyl-tRNA synthetase
MFHWSLIWIGVAEQQWRTDERMNATNNNPYGSKEKRGKSKGGFPCLFSAPFVEERGLESSPMKSVTKRTLVTAALPYANGPIHLGHLAGAYLPADIYCRQQRLAGRDLVFVCGSDEHGVPILLKARKEGVDPQVIVDRYHSMIQEAFAAFGMSFDYYGRTTDPIHQETSQEFFRVLAHKKTFVLKKESQLYDPKAEIFLADRFIRGTCPGCAYEEAYGDQCEKCGRSLSPSDLLHPRSALSDAVPEVRETTHWYLPLGRFQEALSTWIGGHEGWKPNVLGQIKSWLADGLSDRAVTRDLPWGVPVPKDVAHEAGVDAEGKVLYVWFDAPIGYISATRLWAESQGDPELWKEYWCSKESKLIHFIGKDNIVFHCLIFPSMLMAHGDYVLPDNVPANEFLNLEGDKLSTSRGWAVWLHEYLEDMPADYLRYALAATFPEGRDTDFSWKDYQARVNNELADTLGNLANRTLTFAERYFEGKVPNLSDPSADDLELLNRLSDIPERVGDLLTSYKMREALAEIMGLAREGNRYFNDQKPWATRKKDLKICGNTIHSALQLLASLSVLLDPFIPGSCARLRAMLNLKGLRNSALREDKEATLFWKDAGTPLLEAGQTLGKAEILFHKVEDSYVDGQVKKLEATRVVPQSGTEVTPEDIPEFSPPIDFEDFQKLDLRVGVILEAEQIKKSKKLIRCIVDLGREKRQILAGVAEFFSPEDLVGRKVIVVVNLKARKMLGWESQGMILMAEGPDGGLAPLEADGPAGAVVR